MRPVIDTSVVLAVIKGEPGAAEGERLARGGVIGAANFVEAVTRGRHYGIAIATIVNALATWNVEFASIDRAIADEAVAIGEYRKIGLSLGDRLCIGLARARGMPVLTGDRVWKTLPLGVEVVLFR